MAVTELTLLHLKTTELSSVMERVLRQVEQIKSDYSMYPAHVVQQIEDPTYFYIFAGWKSIADVRGEGIRWKMNEKLLGGLAETFDIKWRVFLDLEPSTWEIPFEAPALGISWCFVKPGKKAQFDSDFKTAGPEFGEYTSPLTFSGGWRIDKEGQCEEFVIFTGWNSVEDHLDFSKSEACTNFKKIRLALTNVEVKHTTQQLRDSLRCSEEFLTADWSRGIPLA